MAPQALGSSGAAPGPGLSASCSSAAAEPAGWPQCSAAASQEALLAEWEGISPAANVKIIPEQPSTPASGRVDVGFMGTQYGNCFAHKCGDPPRQSKGRKETPRADFQCCYHFSLPVYCLLAIREGSCWLHGPLVSAPKPGLEHPPGGWFVIPAV